MGFGLQEIHGGGPTETESSSFTALLELPPPQAVELLVKEDFTNEPCFPPEAAALIGHGSKFSVFASTGDSLESATMLSAMVKQEPLDNSSSPAVSNQSLNPTKRKHREKQAKEAPKKSKKAGGATANEANGEKLPYVHVRARRGQATDSHSLAERARREKINARMKLLQELVPGCNKISSTALVLDEIINHVQALQRQVELLSMRLAAVDTRIDFSLDYLLSSESGAAIDEGHPGFLIPATWPENQMTLSRHHHQYQQHPLHIDEQQHHLCLATEDEPSNFLTQDNSFLGYDYVSNSAKQYSFSR